MSPTPAPDRRDFLRATALAAAGAGLARAQNAPANGVVPPAGDAELRVALVGCGGRGLGAAAQALRTRGKTRLVALADAFPDRLEVARDALRKLHGERAAPPDSACFTGLDAAEKAIALADVVLLAEPPGFRPAHVEAAVRAGRHVFLEAPVAVDAPGARRVQAAAAEAAARGLKLQVGFQRREQNAYRDCVAQIQGGLMGDITAGRVYWNDGGVWVRQREPGSTEMQYQVRNWYYFAWTGGDHIVEQLSHNLDAFRWAKPGLPARCQGQGGRQVRVGKEFGEIFDHHFVEYEYADGTVLHAQCRQIKNTFSRVAEHLSGTKGRAVLGQSVTAPDGTPLWAFKGANNDAFQTSQDRFFAAIRDGSDLNEGESAALSTLMAVMGRMATYSGKTVTWDEALNSRLVLAPDTLAWDALPRSRPDPNGVYAIPMPGSAVAL
jgi:myo-inositol 2-dehydrogenase/D-chiro-inositol 1-dehydrogenase